MKDNKIQLVFNLTTTVKIIPIQICRGVKAFKIKIKKTGIVDKG